MWLVEDSSLWVTLRFLKSEVSIDYIYLHCCWKVRRSRLRRSRSLSLTQLGLKYVDLLRTKNVSVLQFYSDSCKEYRSVQCKVIWNENYVNQNGFFLENIRAVFRGDLGIARKISLCLWFIMWHWYLFQTMRRNFQMLPLKCWCWFTRVIYFQVDQCV